MAFSLVSWSQWQTLFHKQAMACLPLTLMSPAEGAALPLGATPLPLIRPSEGVCKPSDLHVAA